MKKQTIITILGILMMASVLGMYGGESYSFKTNFHNPVFTVVGNSSPIDGLIFSYSNGSITINTPSNFKPDNFTLVFLDNQTNEVIKEIRVGGGSRTRYVDRNVTVVQPLFLDRVINKETIKEVEVKKIVYQDTDPENSFELWYVLLAMVLGAGLSWLWLSYKDRTEKN